MYDNSPLGKKNCYKRLPIRIYNYLDIIQQNINDLYHGFEFMYVYIYDITIKKGDMTDHVHELELINNQQIM